MNTTRQMDDYGFVTMVTTELETVEEAQYRLAKKDRARLARLDAQAEQLRASREFLNVSVIGRNRPANAYLRCVRRPTSFVDMFSDAQSVLMGVGALV